ncbi:MAG: DUF721 domain-containing protein, partial [Firmicutes bacterium]|nr:DUF721 domain-containing protein [Bacillota bacterium]
MVHRLCDVLRAAAARAGVTQKLRETASLSVWNDELRGKFPVASRATYVRNRTLHVTVEKSAWAQQFTMLKAD